MHNKTHNKGELFMKKRLVALTLAGIMCASLLAACDMGQAASTAAPATEAAEAVEEVADAAAEEVAAEAEEVAEAVEEAAEWTGDVDEINVLLVDQRATAKAFRALLMR
jgi:hypothetical protein